MKAAALLAMLALAAAASASTAATTTWRGHFMLPTRVDMSVQISGSRASVVLPSGYPAPASVAVTRSGDRIRFSLPGRPDRVVFDGRMRGATIGGSVRQGAARGTFTLRRGAALETGALGVYRLAGGDVVSVTQPSPHRLLVDYDTARVHGLYRRTASNWDIGAGLGVRAPVAGTVRFARNTLTLDGARGTRLRTVESQVRFRSGAVTLAGTLTVPATAGRHAAVVMVHGSGFTPRTDPAVMAAYFAARGLAVLVYDKRGTGQSGGRYPGESAATPSIDTYARDAAAAARFLAAQPDIDRARVGLAGSSQAGWIMPLAAARDPAVRFLVMFSGPAVTAGEQLVYQNLTGEGASAPSQTPAQITAEVRRAGPSGFDPMPSVRKLRIPALWLYGAIDQHVPTELSLERLKPVLDDGTHDFDAVSFASADHFLLVTEHALQSEELRTSRYADKAFSTIDAWLAAHDIR